MILLDTNVISEFMKKKSDPHVDAWARRQPVNVLAVSAISVAEINRGIARLPAGKRRTGLAKRFEAFMEAVFDGRVLPFDEGAARLYGTIASSRENSGLHVDAVDLMIAATARLHNATIATRNIGDFAGCGLRLVDPWADE